jgi:argininosuccinate lyase
VAKGVPFREAHERVGEIVASLEGDGRSLQDVPSNEWRTLDPDLGPEVTELLSGSSSLRIRTTPGGPAPDSVRAQVAQVRALLAAKS